MITVLNLYSKISDILSTDFKINSSTSLIEDGKDATCREVKLKKSGIIAIYKFDIRPLQGSELLPFFRDSPDSHKQLCDYLIFYPFEEKLIVYICNLKSKKMGNTDRQVKNAYVFSKYIVEMASLCLNIHNVPAFVEYKALHFMNPLSATKISTNPRDMAFNKYQNELRYIRLSCNNICSLDWLAKMP